MGLAWQQGPLSTGAVGRFLVPDPLPQRLLFAERLRRRMRVRFGGDWIADSEDVVLLHAPGRYPVAYFPQEDVAPGALIGSDRRTDDRDLGATRWFSVQGGRQRAERAAWEHVALPEHASELHGKVAFAWRSMDAFFEEDDRILGHAADPYHRIDIRRSSRELVVRNVGATVASTRDALVLYESGFAPRWYVPRGDVDESQLTPAEGQTFCPYKGLADYYDVADAEKAAWSYGDAYAEVGRVSGYISFEADKVEVYLDGKRLAPEPGQGVIAHGIDRALDVGEVTDRTHRR